MSDSNARSPPLALRSSGATPSPASEDEALLAEGRVAPAGDAAFLNRESSDDGVVDDTIYDAVSPPWARRQEPLAAEEQRPPKDADRSRPGQASVEDVMGVASPSRRRRPTPSQATELDPTQGGTSSGATQSTQTHTQSDAAGSGVPTGHIVEGPSTDSPEADGLPPVSPAIGQAAMRNSTGSIGNDSAIELLRQQRQAQLGAYVQRDQDLPSPRRDDPPPGVREGEAPPPYESPNPLPTQDSRQRHRRSVHGQAGAFHGLGHRQEPSNPRRVVPGLDMARVHREVDQDEIPHNVSSVASSDLDVSGVDLSTTLRQRVDVHPPPLAEVRPRQSARRSGFATPPRETDHPLRRAPRDPQNVAGDALGSSIGADAESEESFRLGHSGFILGRDPLQMPQARPPARHSQNAPQTLQPGMASSSADGAAHPDRRVHFRSPDRAPARASSPPPPAREALSFTDRIVAEAMYRAQEEQDARQRPVQALPAAPHGTAGRMPAAPPGSTGTAGTMPAAPPSAAGTAGTMPAAPPGLAGTAGTMPNRFARTPCDLPAQTPANALRRSGTAGESMRTAADEFFTCHGDGAALSLPPGRCSLGAPSRTDGHDGSLDQAPQGLLVPRQNAEATDPLPTVQPAPFAGPMRPPGVPHQPASWMHAPGPSTAGALPAAPSTAGTLPAAPTAAPSTAGTLPAAPPPVPPPVLRPAPSAAPAAHGGLGSLLEDASAVAAEDSPFRPHEAAPIATQPLHREGPEQTEGRMTPPRPAAGAPDHRHAGAHGGGVDHGAQLIDGMSGRNADGFAHDLPPGIGEGLCPSPPVVIPQAFEAMPPPPELFGPGAAPVAPAYDQTASGMPRQRQGPAFSSAPAPPRRSEPPPVAPPPAAVQPPPAAHPPAGVADPRFLQQGPPPPPAAMYPGVGLPTPGYGPQPPYDPWTGIPHYANYGYDPFGRPGPYGPPNFGFDPRWSMGPFDRGFGPTDRFRPADRPRDDSLGPAPADVGHPPTGHLPAPAAPAASHPAGAPAPAAAAPGAAAAAHALAPAAAAPGVAPAAAVPTPAAAAPGAAAAAPGAATAAPALAAADPGSAAAAPGSAAAAPDPAGVAASQPHGSLAPEVLAGPAAPAGVRPDHAAAADGGAPSGLPPALAGGHADAPPGGPSVLPSPSDPARVDTGPGHADASPGGPPAAVSPARADTAPDASGARPELAAGSGGGGEGDPASPVPSDQFFDLPDNAATPPSTFPPADPNADLLGLDGPPLAVVSAVDAGTQMSPEKTAVVPKQSRKHRRSNQFYAARKKGEDYVVIPIKEKAQKYSRYGRPLYEPLEFWRNERSNYEVLPNSHGMLSVVSVLEAQELLDEENADGRKKRRKNKEDQDVQPIAEDPDRTPEKEAIPAGGRGRRHQASAKDQKRERSRSAANAMAESSVVEPRVGSDDEHSLQFTPPRNFAEPGSPQAVADIEKPREWLIMEKPDSSAQPCQWRSGTGDGQKYYFDLKLPPLSSIPEDCIEKGDWLLSIHRAPRGGLEIDVNVNGVSRLATLYETDIMQLPKGVTFSIRNKSKKDTALIKIATAQSRPLD